MDAKLNKHAQDIVGAIMRGLHGSKQIQISQGKKKERIKFKISCPLVREKILTEIVESFLTLQRVEIGNFSELTYDYLLEGQRYYLTLIITPSSQYFIDGSITRMY